MVNKIRSMYIIEHVNLSASFFVPVVRFCATPSHTVGSGRYCKVTTLVGMDMNVKVCSQHVCLFFAGKGITKVAWGVANSNLSK